MYYSYLADGIVAIHLAYVAFVVLGLLIILIGAVLRWQWVRNFWFRLLHLIAIAIVAVEAFAGMICPLTEWESKLREMAGEETSSGTFMGRLFDHILFYPNIPQEYFDWGHIAFGALVLITFFLVPPRLPRLPRRRKKLAGDPALTTSELGDRTSSSAP
jgi:hypothetical protein